MKVQDIRISDLRLIKEMSGVHSIRELARKFSVDPQNLTKRIKQLEKTLGAKIVNRSSQGITLTEQGEYLSQQFSKHIKSIDESFQFIRSSEQAKQRIRICGRGFMVSHFLYLCSKEILSANTSFYDFMDLSPEQTERAARLGLLDIVLSFDDILLGSNWMRKKVSEVSWAFYARKNNPLAAKKKINSLKGYALLGFSYIENNRISQLGSPHQIGLDAERSHGCENSRYALQIVKSTDAITYLPDIAVHEDLDSGAIVELPVEQDSHSRPLVLSINKDNISAKKAREIIGIFTTEK